VAPAHYVVFGLLGLAVAIGYNGLGYIGLLAFIAPPVMMRFSLKQYLDKTEENVDELKKRNRNCRRQTGTSWAWPSSCETHTTARSRRSFRRSMLATARRRVTRSAWPST